MNRLLTKGSSNYLYPSKTRFNYSQQYYLIMVKSSANSKFEVTLESNYKQLPEIQTEQGVYIIAQNNMNFIIKLKTELGGVIGARLTINGEVV